MKINNTAITEPTTVKWIFPKEKGINGNGKKLYDPYYSVEMNWNFLSPNDFNVLMTAWQTMYNSGTASVEIPALNGTNYATGTYTALIDRPEYGNYNNMFHQNVKLMLRRIVI